MDKICSLTLLAFFESFRRIAEHSSPVTTNTQKLILNFRLTSDEIVSQLLEDPIIVLKEKVSQTSV